MFPAEVSRKAGRGCQRTPRMRRCLLKGCEIHFHPKLIWSRYCSRECGQAARRWSVARARNKYLQSAGGRAHRANQSRGYRNRRARAESKQEFMEFREPESESEGDQREKTFGYVICARPGCYECVRSNGHAPLVKFCSRNCFRALRRVRQREARWRLARSH